jgi:rhamnulokinase
MATNASTTGLLDARTRQWSDELCRAVGVDRRCSRLHEPGAVLGPLLPHVREATGIAESAVLTAVGSHDTASAVVGVPMEPERAATSASGRGGWSGSSWSSRC